MYRIIFTLEYTAQCSSLMYVMSHHISYITAAPFSESTYSSNLSSEATRNKGLSKRRQCKQTMPLPQHIHSEQTVAQGCLK